MSYRYEIGTRVNARMCSVPMGEGEIIRHEFGNLPRVPLYRVKIGERSYPFYEDEVTPTGK